MIENGAKTQLTQENYEQFCEKYTELLVEKSLKEEWEALRNGFKVACNSCLIEIFTAYDLYLAFKGQEEKAWDFKEWKTVTKYEKYS